MKLCLLTSLPSAAMQLLYVVQTAGYRFSDVIVERDPGMHYDILEQYAGIAGFELHYVGDPNAEECLQLVRRIAPDVLQIVTGTIIRPPLLAIPRIGTLNTHAGMLPRYRGSDSPLWAILEGGQLGVCVHFVQPTIDTGAILARRVLHVRPGDTIASLLWRNHHENKWQATVEALDRVRAGERVGEPQAPDAGKQYFVMHEKLVRVAEEILRRRAAEPVELACR